MEQNTPETIEQDYERVESAILYLEQRFRRQPSLEAVAAHVGLSEFHFQRLFGRWVGISPKRFLQFLTKEHARKLLAESRSVLEAAWDAGLSGPSRLHDLILAAEAVTPGELRSGGEGVRIGYGFHASPFGRCLVAATDRGVCAIRFTRVPGTDRSDEGAAAWLAASWPCADLRLDQERTGAVAARIFAFTGGSVVAPLHLHVRGTNFQLKVWEALLAIPQGLVLSYGDVARRIGSPRAARAVGSAVGDNPVPYLIPCHRVIRESGELGNYGEGPARKKAILAWEAARTGRVPAET
jgi:AraC family transcriptional regulator, regulatory protein of adaptative response / methylated-DNA-[protein]-cysteine methyltransferase